MPLLTHWLEQAVREASVRVKGQKEVVVTVSLPPQIEKKNQQDDIEVMEYKATKDMRLVNQLTAACCSSFDTEGQNKQNCLTTFRY